MILNIYCFLLANLYYWVRMHEFTQLSVECLHIYKICSCLWTNMLDNNKIYSCKWTKINVVISENSWHTKCKYVFVHFPYYKKKKKIFYKINSILQKSHFDLFLFVYFVLALWHLVTKFRLFTRSVCFHVPGGRAMLAS